MPNRTQRRARIAHYLSDNPALCRERWLAAANTPVRRELLAHAAYLALNLPEVTHGAGVADLYSALYRATDEMLPDEVAEWSVNLGVMPTFERYQADVSGAWRLAFDFPTWRSILAALMLLAWIAFTVFIAWQTFGGALR